MPDIPEEAVQAAVEAYTCAWVSGVSRHEELVSVVLEAAAPGIVAQVRRDVAAELRRAAQGRREYDKGDPPTRMHEALVIEAGAFESGARLVEDPMVMLGLIPSWMWTAQEEARLDEDPPARQIGEARADS